MSILTGTSYPISRTTGLCAATGRAIPVGEKCIAVLVEREDGQAMERLDFAVDAWEGGARPQPPLKLVGTWRTVVSPADQKKNRFLDDEELLDLFEQMQDATEPRRAAFRYVLALLLIRRRLLRHEGTKPADNGPPVLLVARRKGENNPVHEVVDPGMADESIAAAVEQLNEIMAPEPGAAREPERRS